MNIEITNLFWSFGLIIFVLCVIGVYCVLVTFNLIRTLIGLELLIKAVTLLIIVAGYITGHEALAQSLAITLIVIEVVVITVAVGVILGIRSHSDSIDARKIRNLKG